MTIAVLDATGATAQVLSAAEMTAALAAIPTALAATLKVQTPIPAYGISRQAKFATGRSGTGAVQLPVFALKNGVTIFNLGSTAMTYSIEQAIGATLTATSDGTGNGAVIPAGSGRSFAIADLSQIWVNGADSLIYDLSGN